jgi:GTPase KRas protein
VETYDPTIEDSYRKQVVIDQQPATLEVLDTAGQEEYTALRDQWIRDGEGFLLVYSITSRSSFARIKNYYSQIERVKDEDPFAIVLVGNKSDRRNERQVSESEGEELATELGDNVAFFESSAKLNINIENAFFECARHCRSLRNPPPESRPTRDKMGTDTSATLTNGLPDNYYERNNERQSPDNVNTVSSRGSASQASTSSMPKQKHEKHKKKDKKCILM